MATKPGVYIGFDPATTSSTIQALLADLTEDELVRVAKAVIRDYQCQIRKAEALFEEINQLEVAGGREALACRLHDYHVATLNMHAQHQLVSLVVSRLGYVPEVVGQHSPFN